MGAAQSLKFSSDFAICQIKLGLRARDSGRENSRSLDKHGETNVFRVGLQFLIFPY